MLCTFKQIFSTTETKYIRHVIRMSVYASIPSLKETPIFNDKMVLTVNVLMHPI